MGARWILEKQSRRGRRRPREPETSQAGEWRWKTGTPATKTGTDEIVHTLRQER